jgi:hypothetical protein
VVLCALCTGHNSAACCVHRSQERGVLCSLVAQQHLLPTEHFAAHGARDGLALAQVHEPYVAACILRGRIHLPAQLTGHAVRRQVV